jgi:hypothetical protein
MAGEQNPLTPVKVNLKEFASDLSTRLISCV